MTIKQKHINANGDTEYTVEHRPSLQCCGAYKNEHGDLELTMHWQDVLFLPIGGNHGICITCGKPFLPTGGRQKRCPDCKGNKPRAGRNTLTAAAQAAAELGISYGKYMTMSIEERSRAKEEKTMAEQEKQTAEVTAEPEQAQDTLQEYIRYLNQQGTELTARLKHIRIALEEAAAYDGVRHSGWRQHKENPCTGGNR